MKLIATNILMYFYLSLDSEIDQLYKICCVLGAPNGTTFPEATNISRWISITYSEVIFHSQRWYFVEMDAFFCNYFSIF